MGNEPLDVSSMGNPDDPAAQLVEALAGLMTVGQFMRDAAMFRDESRRAYDCMLGLIALRDEFPERVAAGKDVYRFNGHTYTGPDGWQQAYDAVKRYIEFLEQKLREFERQADKLLGEPSRQDPTVN